MDLGLVRRMVDVTMGVLRSEDLRTGRAARRTMADGTALLSIGETRRIEATKTGIWYSLCCCCMCCRLQLD